MAATSQPNNLDRAQDTRLEKGEEDDPIVFRAVLALAFFAVGVGTIVLALSAGH